MDRNKFLTDKPRTVVQAEKLAEKKKLAAEKKAKEMAEISADVDRRLAIKKKIVNSAKKAIATQRLTLRITDVPRGSSYGGCGASRGGC